MTPKQICIHIAKRLVIFLILIGIIFGIWYLTYDPHKRCIGDEHRHTDGGLGLFIMIFMVSITTLIVIAIETLVLCFTKKYKQGHANLFLVILIVLTAILVIF